MDAPVAPGNAREPCPDRILDDIGGAFAMGAIGGTALQLIKGAFTSPKGSRLQGGAQLARLNGPRIGGSFAVWGGLFSSFDCTFVYLRQKEDPWNSILAGAATGGFLSTRQGLRPALASAAFGGILLAMIEGVGVFLTNQGKRMEEAALAMQQQQQMPPAPAPPPGLPQYSRGGSEILESYEAAGSGQYGMQPSTFSELGESSSQTGESSKEGSSSWFGGLFGGGKKQEKSGGGGGGSKTEILESFDAPSPPIRFDYK